MTQSPFLGFANQLEQATTTVVSPEDSGATAVNMRTRFTEKKFVSTSETAISITVSFGGATKVLSSFADYGSNFFAATTPTRRIRLFDGEDGTGSVVADSGVLSIANAYTVSSAFGDSEIPQQNLFTFTELDTSANGPRQIPRNISALSYVIDYAFGAAFVTNIGYLWAGQSISLSEVAEQGADASMDSVVNSRAAVTEGGGVSYRDRTNTSMSTMVFEVLNVGDAATLNDLSKRVGTGLPFYFERFPTLATQRDRLLEGGIVRLIKSLKLSTLGSSVGDAADRYTLPATPVAPWR